jgi:poly(3-hydroxybutyrate) depolymerase
MMLYETYQAGRDVTGVVRAMAAMQATALRALPPSLAGDPMVRNLRANAEVLAGMCLTHHRPAFGIDTVTVAGEEVEVREEIVLRTPFGRLLRFAKDTAAPQPRVLLVAPLSGHFATLLRETARTMLADHDVFITDWRNARDVSVLHGRFGLDEYIEHVIDFLAAMGPGAHLLGICQPAPAALAAAAIMAEGDHPATPSSVTLMAGPVDGRVNPTRVNELATTNSLDWFERNLITRVPWRYPGATRRVYPGFMQLAAFMSMNPDRHQAAFARLRDDIAAGEDERAARTQAFYEEYFAVSDLPAEFYLETIRAVFQEFDLARGELRWRGRRVDTRAITSALLTVEGENDDICGVGQTMAAHDLCPQIKASRRGHHLQPGVGHFGVFSGAHWDRDVYPVVRAFVTAAE